MKIFWRFIKPFKIPFIALMIFLALRSICEVIIPTLFARMINKGIAGGDNILIIKIAVIMVGVAVLSMICAVIAGFFASKIATKLSADIRQQLFYNVQDFSLNEIDHFGTSSLITRSTNDILQVQQFSSLLMRMGIFTPLMALSGVAMAIYIGHSLSLILLVSVPAMALVIGLLLMKATGYFKSMQGKIDNINRVLRENLVGMKVIRAFKKTMYEINRFDEVNNDYAETSIIVQRLMGTLIPSVTVLMSFTTIAIMFFGSKMVIAGTFNVGNLVAYIQYITQILMSVLMVSMIFVMYPRAYVSAVRITEVIDMKSSITNSINTKLDGNNKSGVVFNNVTFSYPNAEEPVLENISFTAKHGETTAIIGSTGSGKSTIANLIMRYYDINSGELVIDGINIQDYDLYRLRKKIGYVPQKGLLFTGTIADNISFGVDNPNYDEIVHAANISCSSEFIEEKPNKYDDMISQGGANVSGGQKQRLSIARAIIKNPDIYLFDDSFSALDFKTDSMVRSGLEKETSDKAVIIIAQRVSTIMYADNIVVLDQGKVVGTGTHDKLLSDCAVYREIVESQFKREEFKHEKA